MMTKIILCTLALLTATINLQADTNNFYEKSVQRISKHYGREVRPYMNASYHVAKMWRGWPASSFHERAARNIGWGGMESEFRADYVHYNIPGKPYPGLKGLKVKKFSVDYGWSGLNEHNVDSAYVIARAIQNNRSLSKQEMYRLGFHPRTIKELPKYLTIPQSLSLYRIDVSTAADAKKQYVKQVRAGVGPKKIKISIPYSEPTQDAIDSLLLYRTIVEFDRYIRGWPYQSWNSDAYGICQDILSE
jgi:hypothetical protein